MSKLSETSVRDPVLERAFSSDCITPRIAQEKRLRHFGHDLIEWIVRKSGGENVVLGKTVLSPESEFARDLLCNP